MIDALVVHMDADGEIELAHLSNLTKEKAIELRVRQRDPARPTCVTHSR